MTTKNKQAATGIVDSTSKATLEEHQRKARERFWQAAEQIRAKNKDKDPDVEEVRQEHDEREQREAKRGC